MNNASQKRTEVGYGVCGGGRWGDELQTAPSMEEDEKEYTQCFSKLGPKVCPAIKWRGKQEPPFFVRNKGGEKKKPLSEIYE